ncbi:ubiquitin carboxyl-terminal hydrolase 16-like [Stylonychia lemnae]|uniref:Ubiquitin carboxyl-terminal hydrolase n=1 Tax=Stylonychia lemnae TaxID=5949 RepID=A0A078B5M0_STYLE|nr:ubiquitin carboxyl-terminal hydrolase 16-like [Stylonychia lemnae]|eukprot:CDW88602.1 ubiquitin carboxyl-terminal hydrolase 16-like [Stylonychia lemnae]
MLQCVHYKTIDLDEISDKLIEKYSNCNYYCLSCGLKSSRANSISIATARRNADQSHIQSDNVLVNSKVDDSYTPTKVTKKASLKNRQNLQNQHLNVCLECLDCFCNKKNHIKIHQSSGDGHNLAVELTNLTVYCGLCNVTLQSQLQLHQDLTDQQKYEEQQFLNQSIIQFIQSIKKIFMTIEDSQTIVKNEYYLDEKNRVAIPKRGIMVNKQNDYMISSFHQYKDKAEDKQLFSIAYDQSSKKSYTSNLKRVTIRESESQIFHIGAGFSDINSRVSEDERALELMSEDQIQSRILCYKGLQNLGNSCFFNSIMQCLNSSRSLVLTYVVPRDNEFLFKDKNSINAVLRKFFYGIRSQKGVYSPQELYTSISSKNSRFKGFQQQDAHELLISLLDNLVTEHDVIVKRSREDKLRGFQRSLIEEVFGCYFINTAKREDYPLTLNPIKFFQQAHQTSILLLKLQSQNTTKSIIKLNQSSFGFKDQAGPQDAGQDQTKLETPKLGNQTSEKQSSNQLQILGNQVNNTNEINSSLPIVTISQIPAQQNDENLHTQVNENTSGQMNNSEKVSINENFNYFKIDPKKRFIRMPLMDKIPFFEEADQFLYFEPQAIPEPDDDTLEGCLAYLCRIEKFLDKTNLFYCESCTRDKYPDAMKKRYRTPAIRRSLMIDPPNNLVISLKRFSQTGFSLSKNTKKVSFPILLNMDNYIIHRINKDDDEKISFYENASLDDKWEARYQYRLYAVVSHTGGLAGGHYIAYTSYEYRNENMWFYFSDTFVDRVSEQDVLKCEPYILFYKRID